MATALTQETVNAVMGILQQTHNMHVLDNLVQQFNPDGDQVDKLICRLQQMLELASSLPSQTWQEWRSTHTLFYNRDELKGLEDRI